MSSSPKEPEDLRWRTLVYVVDGQDLDQAAAQISSAIGVELVARHSTFLGSSYKWSDADSELTLSVNRIDGDEPIYPGIPIGMFVEYSSTEVLSFSESLDGLPFLELHRSS